MEFTVTVNTSTDVTKYCLPIQLEWKVYLLKITERYPVALLTPATQSNLISHRSEMRCSIAWYYPLPSRPIPVQLIISEAWVQSQGTSFETCGVKSGTGSVLADFDCALSITIPSMLHTRSYCPVMDNVLISGRSSTQMLSHPTIRITLCMANGYLTLN